MIRVDETDPVGEIEPSFPYRDVTVRRGINFNDQYDIESEIGRGKFGTVYHCKEKTSGLQLAAKVVNTTKKEDRREVEREVEIMRRLQHPRLIQLYDAIDTGKQIYVILELIQGGELFERVIDDDFLLTERSCAVFMRQICEGIEFVHAQHILHLDMKPENILCLTKEGNRIKIIDFGLARNYDPRKKLQVLFGTPEFVAPEVVNFDQIGFGTDMWSIGVICYVLLSGLSPFMGDTDVETMANVTIAKYDFDHDAFSDISEDAKDFIRCLLVKDKEKRWTAAQCRTHRWLDTRRRSPMPPEEPKITTTKPEKKKKKKKPNVTPQVPSTSSAKDELDMTKDNLKLFVERWREHPDSPYILDQDCKQPSRWEDREVIAGRGNKNNLELISLRGQSPSPCGSICSIPSEVSDSPADKPNYMLPVPTNIWNLERRASEGNSDSIGHRRDQAAQIVLAEEIIKLSEHLRTLAMVHPNNSGGSSAAPELIDRSKANETIQDYEKSTISENKVREKTEKTNGNMETFCDFVTSNNESNEISQKLSSITSKRKINGTTFNGSRSYEKQDSNLSGFNLRKTTSIRSSSEKQSSFLGESSRFTEIERNNNKVASSNNKKLNFATGMNENCEEETDHVSGGVEIDVNHFNDRDIDLIPPWRRGRTKHRFGETCRDVPRISNLRDIHKSLNLDEPKSTKDLLLHLLGEWDDNARPGGIGRKSVSVDWGGEESVARRSMNSLAEYFQSEQQKSMTTTGVTTNASTSIHR